MLRANPGYHTMSEVAAGSGFTASTARRALVWLADNGKAMKVSRKGWTATR